MPEISKMNAKLGCYSRLSHIPSVLKSSSFCNFDH